ncbi:hypothetical protein MYSTI_00829 [Myxococcus stipitatus DSM 14675]|uniref:Uncharacterized protein n=1 Tax=Myxococcus stipitatus (strain DSM 14675 / JCM 12634 / Mx s8) TaxID=1278073 RepID=L7U1V0_MYXSD|nr:hypothetical protein [Myxococcus stipitatus]AGC42178.1 hypothetical protein MYSTI_00829 [Myxococcus stipitatus DSM 14675]
MSKDCHKLIAYLVNEMAQDTAQGRNLRAAFVCYASSGKADAQTIADIVLNSRIEIDDVIEDQLSHDSANSCGESANAFCQLFIQSTAPSESASTLSELKEVVRDIKPRIIRIHIEDSHVYVIEQTKHAADGNTPMGYIYQSNIAVIGNPGFGVTLKSFIQEQGEKVELLAHIEDLEALSREGLTSSTLGDNLETYKRLFTTQEYFNIKGVKAISPDTFKSKQGSVRFKMAKHQTFDNKEVLERLKSMFTEANHLTGKARLSLLWAKDSSSSKQ